MGTRPGMGVVGEGGLSPVLNHKAFNSFKCGCNKIHRFESPALPFPRGSFHPVGDDDEVWRGIFQATLRNASLGNERWKDLGSGEGVICICSLPALAAGT